MHNILHIHLNLPLPWYNLHLHTNNSNLSSLIWNENVKYTQMLVNVLSIFYVKMHKMQ